jgi:hypothetical protein
MANHEHTADNSNIDTIETDTEIIIVEVTTCNCGTVVATVELARNTK